jgi:hypothetical protein
MKRVFAEDVLRCRRCGGELRLVAVIQDPAVGERILTHLRLWQRGPAARASRGPRAPRSSRGARTPPVRAAMNLSLSPRGISTPLCVKVTQEVGW